MGTAPIREHPGTPGPGRRAATYEHPLAFWIGVAATTAGVIAQVPMFYMARDMHYQLAGMAVSTTMLVGMVLMFLGIALTGYSLVPRQPIRADRRAPFRIRALDDAPLRRSHIALLLVMAIAITIDVMKPTSFAFLAPGTAAEYGLRGPLNPHAAALPIGLYPLSGVSGTALGAVIWGWMGDRIGRRASILFAAIIFIATSTCGTMPEYWMNLVTCFIMGLGVGGMLPIAFALMTEAIPARHRGWAMVLIGSDIAGAYVIVSWLSSTWASPAHFGWRLLWLIGLPTGLLLIALNHWIPESPRFLLLHGRDEEAQAVMRRYGAAVVPDDTSPVGGAPHGSRSMLSRSFVGLTCAIVFLALSVGITQYGFQQWMPTNLQRLGYAPAQAAAVLRNAALIGLPLSLPVALLYGLWSSKRTIVALTSVLCATLAVFAVRGVAVLETRHLMNLLLITPLWGVSALNAVLAAYTAETFPTVIRARASGISASATKLGGVAVLAFAVLIPAVPSVRATAWFALAPCAIAAVAVMLFGPETRGRQLESITPRSLRHVPATATTPSGDRESTDSSVRQP